MKTTAYLEGLSDELKNSAFFEDVCEEPKKCGRKKIKKSRNNKSGVTTLIMTYAKHHNNKSTETVHYVMFINNMKEVWGSYVNFNNIPVC